MELRTDAKKLSMQETKKYVASALKKRYPFLTKDRLRMAKDRSGYHIDVDYVDGPSEMEMEQTIAPFSMKGGFGLSARTQWFDTASNEWVESGARFIVYRGVSKELSTTCATIACLQQGKPLPRIIKAQYYSSHYGLATVWEMDTSDEELKKSHVTLCKKK